MKEKLVGKNKKVPTYPTSGFSTIELMIAFALICIVLVGAVNANFSAQYWGITAQTANEALYKAKTSLEDLRSLVKQDFYQAVSSPLTVSKDTSDPADASCIAGGLCYYVQKTVTDLSSCSKYVEAKVEWQIASYPTTTTKLFTYLTNTPEIIARGGDCILNQPSGDWSSQQPSLPIVGSITNSPGKQFTGIDVLHKKIYTTSYTSPYFSVYDIPGAVGQNPVLVSSPTDIVKVLGVPVNLNAVDVEEDLATGRTYAFVAVNAATSQLAVIDIFDRDDPTLVNPKIVAQRTLQNVSPTGSYPQGWRVFIYGGRLYIITKYNSSPTENELHIFDISTPTIPTEIGSYKLDRTVNDFLVRGNQKNRLIFIAEHGGASPYSKQLRVLKEVATIDDTGIITNDTVSELSYVSLSGYQEGMSLSLIGNNLYFGRQSDTSGPELYVYDVSDPNNLILEGQGEVGADVTKIEVSGNYAYIETSKSEQEFQVWNSDYSTWDPGTLNAGRFTSYSFPHLTPLGFDIDRDWIYAISQDLTTDKLGVIYTP